MQVNAPIGSRGRGRDRGEERRLGADRSTRRHL